MLLGNDSEALVLLNPHCNQKSGYLNYSNYKNRVALRLLCHYTLELH